MFARPRLAEEGVRWAKDVKRLDGTLQDLIGDVFLSSAFVSYLGAFTGSYREEILARWAMELMVIGVPCTALHAEFAPKVLEHAHKAITQGGDSGSSGEDGDAKSGEGEEKEEGEGGKGLLLPEGVELPSLFSLTATLGSDVQIREWQMQGLPTDQVSTDNAVLVDRGQTQRWPLMIDPQEQAKKWIKSMEAKHKLQTIRPGDDRLLRVVESCIRIGQPLLLEDAGETLDPSIDPVLSKAIVADGARKTIRLADSDVDYDDNFRMYITTKLPNPHYLPEVCIKVNVINFTVTMDGLEDQLLGDVVRLERAELERSSTRLVKEIANNYKQLEVR